MKTITSIRRGSSNGGTTSTPITTNPIQQQQQRQQAPQAPQFAETVKVQRKSDLKVKNDAAPVMPVMDTIPRQQTKAEQIESALGKVIPTSSRASFTGNSNRK